MISHETFDKVTVIRDRLAITYSRQKYNLPGLFEDITYEGGDEIRQQREVESEVCWAI